MSVSHSFTDECKPWSVPVELNRHDRTNLRELAKKIAEISRLPIQAERVDLWKAHNSLKPTRPLIQVRPEGGWFELVPDSVLQCENPHLREWERALRRMVFRHENIHDDWPITDCFNISWVVEWGDYGAKQKIIQTEGHGSYTWDPPIKKPEDVEGLRFRSITIDRQQTQYKVQVANDIFGDVLKVSIHGRLWATLGLTSNLIFLRGLEQTMMDTYDDPALLHRLMSFLQAATLHELEDYERQGVLAANNRADDWVASGGVGATDELPAKDFAGAIRCKDMWGHCESQEFVNIGPAQFEEFVLPYQIPIMKRFGLINYGCCEPLDKKFDLLIGKVPNIRRFSVSPWADREIAAAKLQDKYIYSYKPNPAIICGEKPNFEKARKDLRETMEIAKGCRLEIVMKDTMTFHNDPTRIKQWSQMASQLAIDAS